MRTSETRRWAFAGAAAPKTLAATLALAVAALAATACVPGPTTPLETGTTVEGLVTRVVDGDTIHVRLVDGRSEKVRLIGIDAPEDTERRDPFGAEATAFARRELLAQRVWLETDAELRDRYGRLLAYVWTASPPATVTPDAIRASMFDARMLAEGYATLLTVPPNVRYVDALRPLEDEARRERRGLWGLPAD
ncbi:MAG TPA: thermonuclease family protein [Coriobacteriia bacterium]